MKTFLDQTPFPVSEGGDLLQLHELDFVDPYKVGYKPLCPEDRALVVVHEHACLVLDHIGVELDRLEGEGILGEFDEILEDDPPVASGVYIWQGCVNWTTPTPPSFDDSECMLVGSFRLATYEEWDAHLRGEHPWDPSEWKEEDMAEKHVKRTRYVLVRYDAHHEYYTLAVTNQGRFHDDDAIKAWEFAEVLKPGWKSKLGWTDIRVIAAECWEHGDCCGTVFSKEYVESHEFTEQDKDHEAQLRAESADRDEQYGTGEFDGEE